MISLLVLASLLGLAPCRVSGQTTYRVSPTGSSTPPYDTWDNAFSNIQAAVDAASDGDRI